ncbi:porin [Psychrobacter sp. APC 3279]|uniref:porin n=1 Tax=Psychrobacter sp. APC 3279 TaxID=3035189 RepID=UPI0025B601DA|nr:porin [Psychrobacter sp. APC 3279]MDN3440982.1 porin [Psychrobacter sp. APC 3279]
MKKLLLATAIAALSVSAANAAPTLYGKAFVTADYVNAEFDAVGSANDRDEDTVEINSNSSRIGIRGSEALTANTDVIYQLEYGTYVDGDEDGFKNRDTYLGVVNKNFGEIRAGKNQSTLDYVNNVIVNDGYWDNLGGNKLESNEEQGGLNMADSGRIASSIIWKAPKYNNLPLALALMYSSDEDNGNSDDGFGASLMFDQGTGFTAGVAYDKDQNIDGDIIRGTATVDLGKYMAAPITLGALYQVADFDYEGDTEKEKGFVLSAAMGLANFARPATIYTQYNNTSNLDGVDNADSDQIVVGGKYFFKDNIIAHAYAGMNKAENVQPTGTDDKPYVGGKGDVDVVVVGGGLEYLF